MRSRRIDEAKLRRIIAEEIRRRQQLQEGAWDDVKTGVLKLASYVTKQFGAAAAKWAVTIKDDLSKMSEIPDDVKVVFEATKQGMQATGESLKMSPAMKAAKELGQLTKEKALAFVQEDFEGPVKQKAEAANEGLHVRALYKVLSETQINASSHLNESLTAGTIMGVGLAIMGGLPMLFKGLHKLAKVLHAEKCSALFEKAYHVSHHFEEKAIDLVVPDKLAYFVYGVLWKRGLKLSKNHLELEDFKADKEHAKTKSQGLIYKAVLIYFAWSGLQGVLHAGASLLGFVEGTATTVKGIELARGATEVAALVRAGSAAV
jgi:hypothetical protein